MGKKRNRKDLDEAEEIEYLAKGLRQAESKGDYKEIAGIHNQLGNLYRLRGDYEEAIEHHKQEGIVSKKHFKNDFISLAIAYRNIGEVYIDQKEGDKARPYIERYLKIAKNANNLIEMQRAHITLGRISLALVDVLTEKETCDPNASYRRRQELDNAERQFQLAREILHREEIRKEVCKDKDLADMKCGTYLNLGITFDLKDEADEAITWIGRAITLAKHHGLLENLHRCYSTLYVTYVRLEKYKEAFDAARDASKVAKLLGNKISEFEARLLLTKAYFLTDELEKGVNVLKRLRKKIKSNEAAHDVLEETNLLLTAGIKILRADDKNLACEYNSPAELKEFFEIKADNYVTLGNLQEAIRNYKNSINEAEKCGLDGKPLAALYYSLGATYKDKGDFNMALKHFRKEMELVEGNRSEEFRTQTNIAECMEKAKKPSDAIISAYRCAIRLAEDLPKKQSLAYRNLSQYYKFIGNGELADKCSEKAKQLSLGSTDEEDNSQDLLDDEDDDPVDLSDLSSPESNTDDEGELEDQLKNVAKRKKPVKFRRNEKGETPLHVAAIKGDVKTVRRLIAKGHEINPRDYSGWIPLHEACNHGHYDVVVELLKNKAAVNDVGGQECDGMTPLHDAAGNGHFACIKALVEHGASTIVKDKFGSRPIDTLVAWYHREKNLSDSQLEEYTEIKDLLVKHMRKAGKIYTKSDEKVAIRRASKRGTSPKFGIMKSATGGDDIPVKIMVPHADEDEGKAGVDEYNEAMMFLRRKDVSRKSKQEEPDREKVESREALLAESQYIGEDWLVPDENLAPSSSSTYKRKRDPFEDLRISDHKARRKLDGKRNAVAQMDLVKDNVAIDSFMSLVEKDPSSVSENDEDFADSQEPLSNPSSTQNELPTEDRFWETNSIESNHLDDQQMDITVISDDSDEDSPVIVGSSFRRRGILSRSHSNQSLPSSSSSALKQTKLSFKRISNGTLEDIPPSPAKSDGGRSVSSLPRSVSQQDTPLRLKIDIMGTKILLPVTKLDETIDWLCKETADRYFKECGSGMKLTVSLMTKDGCKLSGVDTIRIAISENDTELTAQVENSTVIELHTRFETTCKKHNIEPNPEALGAMTRCETSEALILPDVPLRSKLSEALFQSLKHHLFLREINLSGCSLHDDGTNKLCSILPTLPKVEKIDISCNGVTPEGLSSFAEVFRKASFMKLDNANYKPPLNMKSLDISHNPLGNTVTESLIHLIKTLTQLKQLIVIDCNLTAALFSKNKRGLISSLNESNIDLLNLSYNHLGKGGVQTLTTEITSTRLQIESTCCD